MLPLGFTELEYLESTGTQYIDTGINPFTENVKKIAFDFYVTDQDAGGHVFVAGIEQSTAVGYSIRFFTSNYSAVILGDHLKAALPNTIEGYSTGINSLVADAYTQTVTLNGKSLPISSGSEGTYRGNLFLFSCNRSDGPYRGIRYVRITSFSIYGGDTATLLRSFIPAKRNSDGELGMYDIVTGTFFMNQGTESFIAGPKVLVSSGKEMVKYDRLPSEYQEVEYLQATSHQYIDTGVSPNQDTSVKIKMHCSVGAADQYQFGIYNTPKFSINLRDDSKVARVCWSSGNTDFSVSVPTSPHLYEFRKNQFYIDDVLQHTWTYRAWSNPLTAYLFQTNDNGGRHGNTDGTIYYCQIWDDTTLVRNFVPCYLKSTHEYGMYDLVSRQFFGNQGTRAFTGGNEVYHIVPSFKSVVVKKSRNLFDSVAEGYRGTWADGVFTSTGLKYNPVSKVALGFFLDSTRTSKLDLILENNRYALTFVYDSSSCNRLALGWIGTQDEYLRIPTTNLVDGKTYTISTKLVQEMTTATNGIISEIQIEEGSTATSYEPYGLIPIPSYKQIIKL